MEILKKYKNGLILGKFMPPHKGHEYLIRVGKEYCDNLNVIVDCFKEQTISPELRKSWIKEMFYDINVVALNENMPQDPSEVSDFWEIWKSKLYEISGKPDVLIAAMDYGYKLAEVLECDFIPLDISRVSIPISATEIRNDMYNNWDFLMDTVKPYYTKKFCFIGPESTGKTTVAKKIAKELDATYVPEYAEEFIKKNEGKYELKDVDKIINSQIVTEKALTKLLKKSMIIDTDIITNLVWAETIFGSYDKKYDNLISQRDYEITFLFYPDVEWVSDEHRKITEESKSNEFRLKMFQLMEKKLIENNQKYIVLYGDYSQKEKEILKNINESLK